MARVRNVLPIEIRADIRSDRRNTLAHYRFDNKADGLPIDLSAYTFVGSVARLPGSTALAAITFENDLLNGIVYAYVSDVDSITVVDAAIASGLRQVVWDIKATPTGGGDEQWFEGIAIISQVVTP